MILEICIDSVDGAIAAEQGGADRLELCGNLVEGGTTPSVGMIREVLHVTSLPVMVMIRSRGGHFRFSPSEQRVMVRDAAVVLDEQVAGIVIGATDHQGQVDTDFCHTLSQLDRDRSITFHRAFDQLADPFASLETIIQLGIDRILTSGQAPSAFEGRQLLERLVSAAADRIAIMAGCGVRAENVKQLVVETGVNEVHGSASAICELPDSMFWREAIPMSATSPLHDLKRATTSPDNVRATKAVLASLSKP